MFRLVNLAVLTHMKFWIEFTMSRSLHCHRLFILVDSSLTLVALSICKGRAFPTKTSNFIIVFVILAENALFLLFIRLGAYRTLLTWKGLSIADLAWWTGFASLSTTLNAAFDCNSFYGNLSKRFNVIIWIHVLALGVPVREYNIRFNFRLYWKLN